MLKIQMPGDNGIKKVRDPTNSEKELREMIKKNISGITNDIIVEYIDEENDKIRITVDDDLQLAYDYAHKLPNATLKLIVTIVKGRKKRESKAGPKPQNQ